MFDSKKKNIRDELDSKKKERHIVTWTPQEDDVLREQVRVHGTENWPIIASKFKDKTTRQCRRRWYTYLNSDFKKGGWSPEEDMLLCEAQKILGNRWTEIAKVVAGRTDNAVKNRYNTLCKKRAKHEAVVKEDSASCINTNGKRIVLYSTSNSSGTTGSIVSSKKLRRPHIQDASPEDDQLLRPPFAVINQNFHPEAEEKDCNDDAQDVKAGETFMRKDDQRIAALMQQAKLLSALALRVDAEDTEQNLGAAWKVLQDFLDQNKDGNIIKNCNPEIDFQVQNLKDMVADFTSSNEGIQALWRQHDLCKDSPASSEYSTGSSFLINKTPDKTEETEAEDKSNENVFHIYHTREISGVDEHKKEILSTAITEQDETLQSCDGQINTEAVVSVPTSKEFGSPLQVTPVFRFLAAGIPSPKFSESERNFLMKTLGMEPPSPSPGTNLVHPPSCKRALLQSL